MTQRSAYAEAMAVAAEAVAAEEASQAAPVVETAEPEPAREADSKPAGHYLNASDDEYRAALAEYGYHLPAWRHDHGPRH
ncbi:hypothetical protein ACWDWT_29085 [Streptomyces sp. NPDC003343]